MSGKSQGIMKWMISANPDLAALYQICHNKAFRITKACAVFIQL